MDIYQKIEKLKEELNQLRPLNYESLLEMKGFFNIDFIYNSNAIEGNTLTLSETKVVIEDGLTIHGKSLNEHMEALGGNDAFEKMFELIKGDLFTEKELLEIHKAFYHRINPDEAGVYRSKQVFISGSKHIPPAPEKIQDKMDQFFIQLKDKKNLHPIELATFVHCELANIHPFIDGNGRTSRLMMNVILTQNGLLPTVIPVVLRSEYISTTSKADSGNLNPFNELLSRMVYEGFKDLVRLLKESKK